MHLTFCPLPPVISRKRVITGGSQMENIEMPTLEELQEMADALLKEADAQQHEIEEEVIKSNKGQLDEKTIASLPAAQLIQNNERLKELFIKGKRHGKLQPARRRQ